MQKKQLGGLVITGLAILNLILWLLFTPEASGSSPATIRQTAAEMFSSTAVVLMGCGLFLTTRPRFLEAYFGGLDRMYVTHRRGNTTAFVLLWLHFAVVEALVKKVAPGDLLGITALSGITVIVLLTLAPRLPILNRLPAPPYHQWRKLHRFIGLFFITAFVHFLNVEPLAWLSMPLRLYVLSFFTLGTLAYLYTELFSRIVPKTLPHKVEAVRRLNDSTVEVTLKPRQKKLIYRAGQFLFVSFKGDRDLGEPHPFTISSSPREENLRLSIKASGDFTRQLYQRLQAGGEAVVEGGYGMFNYKTGGRRQIWIAGGIGVTPFLSWIRDLEGRLEHDIDFFYTVKTPDEALFLEEICAVQGVDPNFCPHISYSNQTGHLTVADILKGSAGQPVEQDIYLCGPAPMMDAFRKGLLGAGVPVGQIHYEEFRLR